MSLNLVMAMTCSILATAVILSIVKTTGIHIGFAYVASFIIGIGFGILAGELDIRKNRQPRN